MLQICKFFFFLIIQGTIGINNSNYARVLGQIASQNYFPYQVLLQTSYRFSWDNHRFQLPDLLCTGSIISKHAVLTAAHCVSKYSVLLSNFPPSQVPIETRRIRNAVKFNKITLSFGCNTNSFCMKVLSTNDETLIKIHPKWIPSWLINDIAIIQLPENLELDGILIDRIRLDFSHNIYTQESVTLSGWSLMENEELYPHNYLRYVNLTVLSHIKCAERISRRNDIILSIYIYKINALCTSTTNGEEVVVGACMGDSGGPLIGANGKQIGIVSFIFDNKNLMCQDPNGVCGYTRISDFEDWIKEKSCASKISSQLLILVLALVLQISLLI